ncbi:hypothetical protein ACP70R_027465 [Stipagrostis hirtigluma subsp. patula]
MSITSSTARIRTSSGDPFNGSKYRKQDARARVDWCMDSKFGAKVAGTRAQDESHAPGDEWPSQVTSFCN